jgi:hypothetical protein
MSNEAHPSSVERGQAEIESALQAEFDQGLYRRWRVLPPEAKRQIGCAVVSALTVLDEEKKEQARRERRAKAQKWYWTECQDIKEHLRRIAGSVVVLTPPTITFRDFEACLCPHGWNWDYCEYLGQSLISLREEPPDASSSYRLRDLRKAHIDLDTARLGEDVCMPGTRDQSPPSPRPAPPNGRPTKLVERTLLQTVVPCLKDAGWTYVRSCDFLEVLLIHSFARKTKRPGQLAYNLDRLRRRLGPIQSPT